MNKPENPYRKGSIIWSVMEGDWEDLTVRQIAEVLDAGQNAVYMSISRIKKETGYDVPRVKRRSEGMGEMKGNELPEDVKQICLWLGRGYGRRKLENQNCIHRRIESDAYERKRMEAVEQALVAVGEDIASENVRQQLRAAILLNVESGRMNPYERLGLEAVSRTEFYRRKSRFLHDIAAYLGMV